MSRSLCIITLILVMVIAAANYCQGDENSALSLSGFAESTGLSAEVIAQALLGPATLSKVLNNVIANDSRLAGLRDINLNFKVLKSENSNDGTLGFSYNYSKDIKKHFNQDDSDIQMGNSLSVVLKGNVASNIKLNPKDFIDSNISFHYFRSQGGAIKVTEAVAAKLDELQDQEISYEAQGYKGSVYESPVFRSFSEIVRGNLTNQYYLDLIFTGGLESDQTFENKQYYFGSQIGLDVKAWNPDDKLAKWNIFDWPFAAIRMWSGVDSSFSPLGSTIPTVLFGVDQVDPVSGVIKEVHKDGSMYTRLRTELSFRTPVAQYNEAYFEMDYRYYQAINASATLRDSHFDRSEYFVANLIWPKLFSISSLPYGAFVSYSIGKLPLDVQSDKVWELGLNYGFI